MESATRFTIAWEQAYERRANGYGPIMPADEHRRMMYAWERSTISFARENEQRKVNGKEPLWDGSISTLIGEQA